ncbi:MAG TPA: ComEC/Rec2 family competence protein [Pyrinomonadaceae bacterium]|nr:ComEC/Rec2 family competence protein [Pyrinomonadaceae bacterium]
MARSKGGCGCAIAVLVAFLGALGFVGYKFVLPWWNKQPPPASGKELRVQVLDVGQGDAILIIAPEKVVLIDAGDERGGKRVVEVLKQNNVQQIDYFVATHSHPDHIGGAMEVFNNFKVLNVIHNDFPPPEAVAKKEDAAAAGAAKGKDKKQVKPQPKPAVKGKTKELPTVKAYNSFAGAVENEKTEVPEIKFEKAEPERVIELGGGARLIILAPIAPPFTKEQIASSRRGNESNANSIVMRLEYGDFSMLLTGDAEEQTEDRLVGKETNLAVNILKVAHHGSKYATSANFLKRVFRPDSAQPKAAIISTSENNRYGHPSQDTLGRLKAAGVAASQLYRTDLQGDITILTTGKIKDGKLYEIKAARETKSDLWTGREGEKNDSSSSGFITYGDYGPPPKQRKK